MNYSAIMGYKKGPDGKPEIDEDQAKIVRYIYNRFLQNASTGTIATELNTNNIPNSRGKTNWDSTSIRRILRNEKYKGDAILQKSYCQSYLTHKRITNQGEVEQYYVQDSHPAIVTKEQWNMVQDILQKNSSSHTSQNINIFSGRVYCGHCGSLYGRKVWHSTDSYKSERFRCNKKFENKCNSPILTSVQLENAFISVLNSLIPNKEQILSVLKETLTIVCCTESLEGRKEKILTQLEVLESKFSGHLDDGALKVLEDFKSKKEELEQIEEKIKESIARKGKIEVFIRGLEKLEGLVDKFDSKLWCALGDKMIIYSTKDIRVVLKDGKEYRARC